MNRRTGLFNRLREISRNRILLERFGMPRLQMSLIVAITGACGFLASYLLLHRGLTNMALRYPVALTLAYLVFLGLLGLWMHYGHHHDCIEVDQGDAVDIGSDLAFDLADTSLPDAGGDGLSLLDLGDAEGLAVGAVIAAVIGVLIAIGAAFFIVLGAPALMAELLVDIALARGLYKSVHSLDADSHWLVTAIRRTGWRFFAAALAFAVAGAAVQHFVPGAVSLGDAFR